jgi:hypothetical protein
MKRIEDCTGEKRVLVQDGCSQGNQNGRVPQLEPDLGGVLAARRFSRRIEMTEELPFDDYKPPAKPLADDPEASLNAVSLAKVCAIAGEPDAFCGKIFSDEAVRLAKAGRMASGQPGSDGSAVFREGVHPDRGMRYLVFPGTLPRRAMFRLERFEMRRYFPV